VQSNGVSLTARWDSRVVETLTQNRDTHTPFKINLLPAAYVICYRLGLCQNWKQDKYAEGDKGIGYRHKTDSLNAKGVFSPPT
jgi:hypothetical protein